MREDASCDNDPHQSGEDQCVPEPPNEAWHAEGDVAEDEYDASGDSSNLGEEATKVRANIQQDQQDNNRKACVVSGNGGHV